MLIYSIEQNLGQGALVQKILHIKGKADSTQWERLRSVFFDSLTSCDHLIVNIENVEEYDYSFIILICSTRRTAHLLGKRLTITGKSSDSFPCIYSQALKMQNKECAFSNTDTCYLWESYSRRLPELIGKCKKRPVHKKIGRDR